MKHFINILSSIIILIITTSAILPSTYTSGGYTYSLDWNSHTATLTNIPTNQNLTLKSSDLDFMYSGGTVFLTTCISVSSAPYCETLLVSSDLGSFKTLTFGKFQNAKRLKSVEFLKEREGCSEIEINKEAFGDDCVKLTQIKLTDITSIGSKAFYGMTSGVIVCNGTKVPTLAEDGFSQAAYDNVYLYVPSISIYQSRTGWENFKNIYTTKDYITEMAFQNDACEMYVGENMKTTLDVTPTNANREQIMWSSSNEDVATVENGVITALKCGEATITADAPGEASAICKVTVTQPVTSITLSSSDVELKDGFLTTYIDSEVIVLANIEPENATNKELTWLSANNSIASVDSNGKIKATSVGETSVTATAASGVSATVNVKVLPIEAISIEMNPAQINLQVSEKANPEVIFTPTDTTDKTLIWGSSDKSVATVEENGEITAHSLGQTTITAHTTNGKTANCVVTVISTPAASISLNRNSATMRTSDTVQLSANIFPETTTNKFVFWESDALNVAKVDDTGLVTAVAVGDATISATTINGLTATCKINVIPTMASVLSLNPVQVSLMIGEELKVDAEFTPSTTTDKTLDWTSSNSSVASVDDNGLVQALSTGTTRIMASTRDGSGLTAICFVTVVPVPVESISLTPDEWNGPVGDSFQLTATVIPENATDKEIIWQSDNASVASVDDSGLVTAVKAGVAIISATAADGSGIVGECLITVLTPSGIESILQDRECHVKVFNPSGNLIYEGRYAEANLNNGIYIITTTDSAVKVKID